MKMVLLGKNGQLGHELERALRPLGQVTALGRDDADMGNLAQLETAVGRHRPEVIINAAAYTAVDRAEDDETTAFRINADAVEVLGEYARRHGALLVHYSTDYVFDGEQSAPYRETDATNPQSVYGRSKRAGEKAIEHSGCRALMFRTSWVYSSHGANFIKTVLRLAHERDTLNVVADQYGAPASAELIALVTARAIAAHDRGVLPPGLYHLTAAGETTWHGLACRVVTRARENGAMLKLNAEAIRPIPTEAYPLPAKRPKNSRLDTSALSRALDMSFPDWKMHVDHVVTHLSRAEAAA